MSQNERKEIIKSLIWVDKVIISRHPKDPKDMSVNRELKILKPHIFANGGDRKEDNVPEVEVCRKINCQMVFNVGRGGKIQSSSWLLEKFLKNVKES